MAHEVDREHPFLSLDDAALADWFRRQPLQWSIVLPMRAALRSLPLMWDPSVLPHHYLFIFGANAFARFSAKYPNSALDETFLKYAEMAADRAEARPLHPRVCSAAAGAAYTAIAMAKDRQRPKSVGLLRAHVNAASTIVQACNAAGENASEMLNAYEHDATRLGAGMPFGDLIDLPLWHGSVPLPVNENWRLLVNTLQSDGDHWSVWVKWYSDILAGSRRMPGEDKAFTDLPGELDWLGSAEAVNFEISRRLAAFQPDPSPIEGITSPITIDRQPDGRIGVEPGPFSLPTVPNSHTPTDHRSSITACRNWASQLKKLASSPEFQGRREYAQILAAYLKWLPNKKGKGNMLLADGEVRTLNKLFTAEEAILPTYFGSKLSVLLEDHIALRSYYPEIERHYQAVNTGRLITPLSRDAVQAIQAVIRLQTPAVFNETVSEAIDEAAKPVPDITPLPSEELPPPDPTRPRPPNDPIAEADPKKSKSYIIATAYNRIWSILKHGKDAARGIEGWQKTYQLLRPHIGAIIDFLRSFYPGDGPGSLPPTISA